VVIAKSLDQINCEKIAKVDRYAICVDDEDVYILKLRKTVDVEYVEHSIIIPRKIFEQLLHELES